MHEMRVRWATRVGALPLVLGGLLLVLPHPVSQVLIWAFLSVLLIASGVLQIAGTMLVITPQAVEVRAPIQIIRRRQKIAGIHDLRINGKKLIRVGDRKSLARISRANREDISRLRSWIAAANAQ